MTGLRILVTGSRNWTDRDKVYHALADAVSGSGQTARMARAVGIRVIDYGVDTRKEARP